MRDDAKKGSAILTLDAKNAFNTPHHNALQRAIMAHSAFAPFAALLDVKYGAPSDLFVFNDDDSVDVVVSSSGSRQGSSLGGLYFCALLQPILRDAAEAFDGNLYAYMDDITISGSPTEVARAYSYIEPRLLDIGLHLNYSKCEILLQGGELPETLLGKVAEKAAVIKVLGAYVGQQEEASNALAQKLAKHDCLFRRIAQCNGPLAFALLRKCGLPRANYAMRTHDPDTSADACTWFDGRVRDTFRAITQARLDDNDWLVAGLPPRHGGVGLYTASVFRSAASQASHDAACATEGVPACAQIGCGRRALQRSSLEACGQRPRSGTIAHGVCANHTSCASHTQTHKQTRRHGVIQHSHRRCAPRLISHF